MYTFDDPLSVRINRVWLWPAPKWKGGALEMLIVNEFKFRLTTNTAGKSVSDTSCTPRNVASTSGVW